MKCKRCGGSKEVRGLGFTPTRCPACDGLGFIMPKQEEEKPKRKRGRPKKDVISE